MKTQTVNKKLTFIQIGKLRPSFKFGGISMIDWFEVTRGKGYCVISSGLCHADGETKSPFYYYDFLGGKDASKECLRRFNEWWIKVNKLKVNK